jgi:hypothetical protein
MRSRRAPRRAGALVLALAAAFVVAAHGQVPAASPASGASVRWLAPADEPVVWRGLQGTAGGAVGGAPMMYPGGAGLAGFLVAILTHGAIASGAQSAAAKRAQEEADRVFDPHRAALGAWPLPRLWAAAQQRRRSVSGGESAMALRARPVFAMTQDRRTLLLDLELAPEPSAKLDGTALALRVVAPSLPTEVDASAHWSGQESQALLDAAAALLAHSLEVAERFALRPAGEDPPHRSHRYLVADESRVERGQLLASGCARSVIRTLRGGLLSVPTQASAAQAWAASTRRVGTGGSAPSPPTASLAAAVAPESAASSAVAGPTPAAAPSAAASAPTSAPATASASSGFSASVNPAATAVAGTEMTAPACADPLQL